MDGALDLHRVEPAVPTWLTAVAAISMLVALYLPFMWVSTEATMGIIQRIFYFHMPAAIIAFVASFVGGIASIAYLKTGNATYDDLSVSANESVVVFESVNIVMGSIWGRRSWGIWWTWDARLTSALILLLIYVAYLILRSATPYDQRARICAVVSIFGMADVPFVYLANRISRTQHPGPVLGGGENSGLAPDMLLTLAVSIFAMLLLWWCLMRVRRRLARTERAAQSLIRESQEIFDAR